MRTNKVKHLLMKAARRAGDRLSTFLSSAFSSRTLSRLLLFVMVLQAVTLPSAAMTTTPEPSSSSKRAAGPAPRTPAGAAQTTETFTIYGPHRFDRKTGAPVTVTESFALPGGAIAPFTLSLQNGAANGANRVSSATVKLNGAGIFTKNDFSQQAASLTRAVALNLTNTLEVQLASAPGSYVTITVTATRSQNVTAALASITPARLTQGQALSVTLRGQNTHWAAGQTRASLGEEISVGGAAPGELGPVTVTDATTAVANVIVSSTAALAPHTAQVTTPLPSPAGDESVSLAGALTVASVNAPGSAASRVTTVAGLAGSPGFADGAGAQARFSGLSGVAVGPDDTIYVADAGNNRVRVVRGQTDSAGVTTYTVSTLAGNATAGYADGLAASARFNGPQGVAVDGAGVVYVADTGNNRVRRIASDGLVTTLAGDGTPGFANGAGAQARFNAPRGVAVDNFGNVYVADSGNSSVRRITPAGDVSTVAGDGTVGSSDSPPARFDNLSGIACDGEHVFVYFGDTGNHRIRRLDATGAVITVAGASRGFADGSAGQARFAEPSGLALEASGKIVVADAVNSLVRSVDPELAAGGSPLAVSTLAGTGERGGADGAGNVARFYTPRGVAVSQSSAIIVADTGNGTIRRVLLPPVITSLSPQTAQPGEQISLLGERFNGRSPGRNTVKFIRSASSGGGQTAAHVVSASRTAVTVEVPPDAASGPITLQTEGGTATSPVNFTLAVVPAPVITDFNPKHGSVGTSVIIAGANLRTDNAEPSVTFQGAGGTRLPALITFSGAAETHVVVPNGAVTGNIDLTTTGGRATSPSPFAVDSLQDFRLTVAPSSATAVRGGTATYIVSVNSDQSTFTQLARLSVSGLPASVTATFAPAQITSGANSTLSVSPPSALAAGSYQFTITAVAEADGHDVSRGVTATLNVLAGGQTTLAGRVLSTEDAPIMGATVSLDGHTATTDAAGSFILSGVNAGSARPLMVDGRTASAPNRTYPVILEPANIVAGQANVIPYNFYLPPIDTQYEVQVVPGQNTIAGNPRVPGLQMTIPASANLRNRDGSPVTRVSITPLAIDRTPTPLPANIKTSIVYTSQPGGALTDVPVPVVYPNLAGADPGTRVELYAFDHDIVRWYVYGYGRVSADGRTIAPEINPSTGRLYGLRDFSWHFPAAGPGGNPGGGGGGCPSSSGPNPVDFSTGMKMENATDISFVGARGGLELTRIYTSDLAQTCDSCPFGRGWTHNYAVRISGSFVAGGAGRVLMPEEGSGRLFNYTRTDPDGSLVFTTTATIGQLADILRKRSDGTFEYRDAGGTVMRFDAGGKLTARADRNGNTTTLTYSGANLTRVTDAVGRSITLDYDFAGRVTRATDPTGRAWRYTYEGTPGVAGTPGLTTVTDPHGGVVSYGYVQGGRLASVTDPRGNFAKRLTYDNNGRVIEQKFADGSVERYSYQLAGELVSATTITDPLGRSHTRRFNSAGYVIELDDTLGQTSHITRDLTNNLPSRTTGSCGCPESEQQFDARGNLTAITDQLGSNDRYEYEPVFNNVTRMTDKLGRVTTFTYDDRGNLTSVTDALNETTSYLYDQYGQLTSITDPLGHVTRMEYAPDGSLRALIDPLNNRMEMESDGLGRLTASIDPLGRRSSMTYDTLGRVETMTDSNAAVTTLAYDANGNKVKAKDATGQEWTMVYDGRNRQVSNRDPLGRVSRMSYDANDQLSSVTTASGRVTRYLYDVRGQVSQITDPINGIVRLAYDTKQQVTTLSDQRGNVTTFAYDELSRPVSRRDALGQLVRVRYDAAGNVVEKTDRLGRQTTITYDGLDRPVRIAYPDAVVTYTFDAAGRPTRIDDSQSGAVDLGYDAAGRLISETTPAGTVSYTFNAAGQRTEMRAADRAPVTYDYDAAGRLRHVGRAGATFTYGYDTLSRRASLQRPNGVTTTYTYDAVNRLKRLTHGGGQLAEDYHYAYNADDEIAAITSNFGAPLLSQQKEAAAADALNRVAQVGGTNYAFNAEGQTTSQTDAQGTTSYQWDSRGRLTQASLADGRTVGYSYDALGRRARRTSGGVTTSFLYDGHDIVLDRASDGGTVDYLNGLETDEKLQQTSATTGALYFIQDHLDSVVALTDGGGNVVERTQYEPFGASAGSALTRYGFTGRERDPLTGLLYYRARWYDSRQGRFLSEDPIEFDGGGANFYAYTDNDPVNSNDPLGLQGNRRGGGGPYHPPDGVSTRCTNGDSCPTLQGKMFLLMRMINSHTGWDRHVPSPRGGNRHAAEIADLWRAYANCQAIYARNCPRRNPRSCPVPAPVPAPAPAPAPAPTPLPGPVPSPHPSPTPNPGGIPPSTGVPTGVKVGVGVAAGVGIGYLIYRGVRLLPSLAPPLWWTLPANLAIP